MISTLLIIAGILIAIVAAATIVGMAVSDIRDIRAESAFRKHPRGQRYRRRPIVAVLVNGEASDRCLASIRQSSYRKIVIINLGENPKGSLLLRISPDAALYESAISDAVYQFNMDPSRKSVEMLPAFIEPATLLNLFHIYRNATLAPFIAVRSLFRVTYFQPTWPLLTRSDDDDHHLLRLNIYLMFRWLAQVANVVILSFAIYLAIVPLETFYMAIYLAAFGFWLLLSIATYPRFSFGHKIKYALLSPVSLSYFMLLAFMAPIRPLGHLRRIRLAPRRQNVRHDQI